MLENFDFEVIARSWQVLIFQGLAFTLEVTVLSMIGGVVLGTLLAMMRLSSIKPMSWLASGYVNLLRSVPLVLVIFWFYFLVPYIGAWIVGANQPIMVRSRSLRGWRESMISTRPIRLGRRVR